MHNQYIKTAVHRMKYELLKERDNVSYEDALWHLRQECHLSMNEIEELGKTLMQKRSNRRFHAMGGKKCRRKASRIAQSRQFMNGNRCLKRSDGAVFRRKPFKGRDT